MASMDEIYRAFLKADAAGDTQSARILAGYIRERTGYTGLEEEEKEERTFGKYAKEAFKGLIPGAVSGIETAIAGAASVLPEEAEQAVRRKVSEVAEPIREAFAPEAGYEETLPRQLSEAVGSTLPFLGVGLAGRLAAAGLGVATGAGEARQRAEQEGATEGERAAATALGVVPGALESLPPVRILRRFGFGKEAIDEVAGLAPSLRRIAVAGGEEALQEASTQVLQNLIAKGVYKPEEEVFGGVTEAAELGGGAGAIVGAIAELALGRRLRGTEPPPEEQEEGITEEPTPPVTPATGAEAARRARIAPSEQMELPLDTEAVQIPMFGEEEAAAPTPSLYRPAEDALADLKPRSRAYKEEARSLGLKLDRKGNVKPNQFVFEQPEAREYKLIYTDADGNEVSELFGTLEAQQEAYDELVASGIPAKNIVKKLEEAPLTQGRFEFEIPQEQPDLPMYVPPVEGQMDMFGTPMPRGGEMPTVPTAAEMPVVEEVPEEQYALNLPGIPMERLTPRDRVLRAMAITEDKKNIPNLRFATELRPMELQKTLGDLKKENAIKFNKQANEWELTPEGAERVRTPRKKIGSARLGRGADVSVPPSGTPPPPTAGVGEPRVAGVGAPPAQSDVGEEAGQPALTKTADELFDEIKSIKTQALSLLTKSGKVPAYGSEKRQQYDALKQQEDTLKQQWGEASRAEERAQRQAPTPPSDIPAAPPVDRMAIIRRAQEKRVAEDAVKQIANRRTDLRTKAIDAFEKNAINEATYNNIIEELKKPVPNFGLVNDKLAPRAKVEPVAAKPTPAPQAPAIGLREDATDEEIAAFYKKTGGSKAPPKVKKERGIPLAGVDREAESAADEFLRAAEEKAAPAPTPAAPTPVTPKAAAPEAVAPTPAPKAHPEWATKFEPDVGGEVVYSDPDTALVRGSSVLSGQNVYMAVDRKTGSRTRVDIESFTGGLFNPEQKQRLVQAKKQVVAEDKAKFDANPDGPFTGATSNIAASDSVNPNYANFLRSLTKSMGLGDIRVFLFHPEDVRNNKDKYKLYGTYSSALSAGLDVREDGSLRPYGADLKDFYISIKPGMSEGRTVETIAHELGHLIEKVAYNNASPETKAAIRAEYEAWLKETKGKQGAELVRALRNRETAEAQAEKIGPDAKLSDSYWRSFSEWFADNTSKWATTSEKPVGIVEKFFADLAKRLRELVSKLTGNRFVPAKSVKDFLDAMGPGSADSWIAGRGKSGYDPASASAASYSMSPDERIKTDRALVNSVGSSQNRLPEPTARIKEGARTAASMIPRWLRRGVFSFESTHQLADMYRPYTDKLDELWDLQNRDGAALRLKTDKIHDNLKKWHKVMDKFPPAARERIYNLFLDTTVDQIEVLDSAADPVLRDNAAVKNMKVVMKPNTEHSLYKQFSQLPQPVRDLYRDLRLAYLEDANEMEQLLSQYITPSEWQKLQMEFNKKRLAVYLPLFRSGEYKLVYTDKDGETVSRQFETSEEREKAFREVRSSGIPESKIVRKMASEFAASDIPPAGFYGKVVAKLRENDVDEKTIAKLFDLYMDYMPATSVLQLRRKRKKTPGYESDVLRAYASVGGAYARRLVNMRFMPQINKAFEDLRADLGQGSFWVSYKDSKGKTVRNGYDTDELRRMAVRQAIEDGADRNSVKYFSLSDEEAADIEDIVQGQIDFFNNPKLDNYASKAAYFSFTMYMGGNVSSAIIDLTHIPMVVYSLLGSKYGFGRAAASMKRAHRYYMNPKKKLPPEIAELPSVMKRATEDGILGEQRIMDLAEFNNRFGDFGSKALEVKARVDRAMGSIFAMSDRYNRGLTFISAYELAKNQLQKKGLKGDELLEAAYTDAKRAVYDSYGSSFPKAGPSIMQNGLARLALTFKRFALNRMWLLFKALDQATRGESKEVKNMARAQLLGFYGMAYIFSGAQGLPFVGAFQLLASLFNGMFGDDDELYDVQDAMRQAVGMFNYRGPINYVLGVDIASRSGWDQMLWRDDPRRIAEVGPATYAMEQLLGPAFSYAVNAPRAFEHFSEGRFSQGMETLTPRVIANIFKAFRYGTEGALTKDNIPVVDDISKRNQFMQLLGFAPTKVGEAYQQAGVAKKFEREIDDRRESLIRRAMMAIVSEDDEGRVDALKEIRKFNEKHPGKPITDESISRSVTNHYIKLNQSVNGVRVDPKLAQEIYDRLGYDTEDTLDESTLEEEEDLATDLLYE